MPSPRRRLSSTTPAEDFVAAALEFTGGRGVDVVLDVIGGEYLERNLDALGDEGHDRAGRRDGQRPASFTLGKMLYKRARLVGTVLRARPLEEKAAISRRFGREMLPLFDQGLLKPVIDRHFSFDEIVDGAPLHGVERQRRQDRARHRVNPRRRPPLRFGRLLLASLDNRCCAHPGGALRRPFGLPLVDRHVVAQPAGRCTHWRGRAIFWSLSSSSSIQCASQPDVRGMANSTVNISIGKPIAW